MTRRPTGMRTLSLCTGYGGFELGLRAAGIPTDLVAVADPDPAAAKVLAHHDPAIPNLGDITKQAWTDLGPIDLLCAGYPCQGFSHAGKRKGIEDERFIWPAVADAIRVLRPRRVLLENVAGHRSLGFGRVLADLAAMRYVGSWVSVRASDVGAAHRRERVFILAWPADTARPRLETGRQGRVGERPDGAVSLLPTPHANCATGAGAQGRDGGLNLQTTIALLPSPRATDGIKGGPNQRGSSGDLMLPSAVQPEHWGQYHAAIERWARIVGRPVPEPTEAGPKGGLRLASRFVEWLMGVPQGWVCDVPGLSHNDQLRLLGNGVVPQQAAYAIASLHNIA